MDMQAFLWTPEFASCHLSSKSKAFLLPCMKISCRSKRREGCWVRLAKMLSFIKLKWSTRLLQNCSLNSKAIFTGVERCIFILLPSVTWIIFSSFSPVSIIAKWERENAFPLWLLKWQTKPGGRIMNWSPGLLRERWCVLQELLHIKLKTLIRLNMSFM